MLAHVRDAEKVGASIEGLDLGRRFDAVLVAGNLVNAGLPLDWSPEDGETVLGGVVSRLHVERVEDGVVHGSVEYDAAGERWRDPFAMCVFADDAELGEALADSGLRLERRLDARWFVAAPTD